MGNAVAPQDVPIRDSGRRKRGVLARLSIACLSAVFMLSVVVLGLFVFLGQGRVTVPLLKERIAVALETRIGSGVDVEVGTATLEKTEEGLDLHIYDVVFRDQTGREILRSPEALVGVSPLELALLKVIPRRLALKGITIKADVRADGEVRFSSTEPSITNSTVNTAVTTDAAGASAAARPEDLLGFLAMMAQTGTFSGLSDFSIRDARLVVDDRRVGREIVFDNVVAQFANVSPGRATVAGSVRRGGQTVPFRIEASGAGENTLLNFNLSNLTLKLAEAVLGLSPLPVTTDVALAITASIQVGADGRARSGSSTARLSPGPVLIPGLHKDAFRIEDVTLEADWRGGANKLDRISFRYAGDGSRGKVTGHLLLPGEGQQDYRFEGVTEELTLSPLRSQDHPVVVTEGRLAATVSAAFDKLRVESLDLDGPETEVKLQGGLTGMSDGVAADLQLTAGRMPIRTAVRWWPFPMAPEGRVFAADNVREGTLTGLTLSMDLSPTNLRAALNMEPLPPESLRLDFGFEAGVVQALEGVPPVSGLVGTGWLNAREAKVAATRGALELRGAGKRLQLSDGALSLTGLDTWHPNFTVAFRSQGALEHVAEFLNLPPLRDVFALKVNAADIRGQFDGRASVSFDLGKPLKPTDIKTEVAASLRNVTLDKAIGRDKLENANLTISADATGVDVKGEGRWQGVPVTVSVENDAQDKSSATVLSFTLDEAAQKRIGIGLAPQLTGPLPVKVRALKADGEGMRAQAEIDLTRATIDGLIPGFQKPAGRAGKLSFEAIERPGKGYLIQNIALDSGASSFRGLAETAPDGTVTSARLSLFRLSPGDNVRVDFDRTATGGKVVIRGNNFDARPFLRQATQDGPPGGKPERDLDLELKTTLLSGNNGEVITNADMKMQRRGGQMRQMSLTGRINGKSLSLTGQASDRPAPITIEADDAGAFLRFADIYSRMVGGDLAGQIAPQGRAVNGFLMARNFSLRNEPALRSLTAEAAPDGAQRATDTAAFAKMRIDFSRTGSSTTIREAVIFGPAIGLTFNGTIDPARDRISLSGTFIPAYGLNNAFAQIPVIGNILGGGRNEGLLAVTFGVSGRASQPTVNVNPLSAVAPGIFRKMFEFRNERTGTSGPPAYSPAPTTPN